jgi:hypothetical protein
VQQLSSQRSQANRVSGDAHRWRNPYRAGQRRTSRWTRSGANANVLRDAAQSSGGVDLSLLQQYDRYYLDRRRERPLPVVVAQLHNADRTRVYINPKTARVVAVYESPEWISRWLYHALHSLDFPWLYNHRPLWDIVVITFMTGGTALSLTSLILAWRVLGRKLRRSSADLAIADDLYIDHERSAIP